MKNLDKIYEAERRVVKAAKEWVICPTIAEDLYLDDLKEAIENLLKVEKKGKK